jgi:hypothetical protein
VGQVVEAVLKVVMLAVLLLQLHKRQVNTELYKDTQVELV